MIKPIHGFPSFPYMGRGLRLAFGPPELRYNNKHLMTGAKGNSEFCFPATLRSRRNKTHFFPRDQSLSVFFIPPPPPPPPSCPNSKLEKTAKKKPVCFTHLPQFQGARPDHVRVESSYCRFSREQGVSEFWPTTRDAFSPNRKTYLSWKV